ncbi:WD repeat-containing protein WRAP73 [Neolecta irregularis DAH-3]|uniref:WD repeat-containing protein WRAP73 n=1 Tax=Neolecta irregularis (strain DAH-3) TaxID=1198029 RepID=A0A1U7LU83_NEOID|nr:WD repeat-containing protein WRAP73 [Neolecta irregularis DAH-3]|eukprot:OLL26102.1 WD repeat-containing protein WRAP73 [Neolecta irregularis DAH-3]
MDLTTTIACLNPPGISIIDDQIVSYNAGRITIRCLDNLQTRLAIALNSPEFCSRRIHSLQFSPSGQKLLIANENEVKVFDLENNDWSAEIKEGVGGIKSVYWGLTDDEILVFTDLSVT